MMHRAAPPVEPPDTRLVDALLSADAFPHPAENIELLETHISWVILAGAYAYKIKKPIVLDFLDFGTLERRRFFCEEELRLNQPYAPEIYLDVVPIVEHRGRPRFGGDGEAVEYALRMRRFDQGLRLDRQLEAGKLTPADMRELGQVIAARHLQAAVVPAARRERQHATTRRFIEDNFTALDGFADAGLLAKLASWSRDRLAELDATLWQRFDDGFVRDCHGDLHLGNIVRLPAGISTFDCIEFDPELREIDVFCDLAFLVMDLVSRERHDLAAQFLNRYLERSGDYAGTALLDLFFVYRCLVRAKVAAIGSAEHTAGPARDAQVAEIHRYCRMAERQVSKRPPILVLMHGLSGSGKTWLSGHLMARLPAIRIRSDIERKRLHGVDELQTTRSPVGGGIYDAAASEAVYGRMADLAATILAHGHNVILDAAFLSRQQRVLALGVAERLGLAACIVRVDVPENVLRLRLDRRAAGAQDASEAGQRVLDHQLETREELTTAEAGKAVICDNPDESDIDLVVGRIRSVRESSGR
jgi:aminoglycoside phosphotransferase family enzyme